MTSTDSSQSTPSSNNTTASAAPSSSSSSSWFGKCLKVVLGIVAAPVVLVLLIVVWLMRHVVLVSIIQFILVLSFFLNVTLHLSSSTTSTMSWNDTIWDMLIVSFGLMIVSIMIEVKWPWPSHSRRAFFTLLAAGVIAFVITKWSAISSHTWARAVGGGHAMLVSIAISSGMMSLGQWWILTSRSHLKESQDKVIALELRDHFATPVDRRAFSITEHMLAGVSYYLVDELPTAATPPSPPLASSSSPDAHINENKEGAIDSPSVHLSFPPDSNTAASASAQPSQQAATAGGDSTSKPNGASPAAAAYGSFDNATQKPSSKPFLVVLHGYMGGKAIWVTCFGSLVKQFRLVVLDVPGMGLCERPAFRGRSAAEAESFFAGQLEAFRIALLAHYKVAASTPIWLMGHSYGGYIAAVYTLAHPAAVSQLILASPVGLPIPPPNATAASASRRRAWLGPLVPILAALWDHHWVNPQAFLRFLGPLGPILVRRIVEWRFDGLPMHRRALADYIYHLNASPDSGNATFTYILGPAVFARSPLRDRLLELRCPTHFVYGAHDWMDPVIGREVSTALRNRGVISTHHLCPDAGHQLFMENAPGFYQILLKMMAVQSVQDAML